MEIEIKIRSTTQELVLKVSKDVVIGELKKMIYQKTKIPVEKQRLIYSGKLFRNDKKLSFYNVSNGDVVHLVRMEGTGNEQRNQPRPTPVNRQNQTGSPFVRMSSVTFPNGSFGNLNGFMSNIFNSLSQPRNNQNNQNQNNSNNNQNNSNSNNPTTRTGFFPLNWGAFTRGTRVPRNNQTSTTSSTNQNAPSRSPEVTPTTPIVTASPPVVTPSSPVIVPSSLEAIEPIGEIGNVARNIERILESVDSNRMKMRKFVKLVKRKSSLNELEKKEMNTLLRQLTPVLRKLGVLESEERPKRRKRSSENSMVDGVTVHIHSSVSEMDELPQKLRKLRKNIEIKRNSNGDENIRIGSNEPIPSPIRRRFRPRKTHEEEEEEEGEQERKIIRKKIIKKKKEESPDDILGSVLYGNSGEDVEKIEKIEKKVEDPDDILGSVLNEMGDEKKKTPEDDDGPTITEVNSPERPRRVSQQPQNGLFNLLSQQLNRPPPQERPQTSNGQRSSTTTTGPVDFTRMLRQFQPILRNSLNPQSSQSSQSVFSTLNQLNSSFGIVGDNDGELDKIFSVALNHLNMREWLSVMQGDFKVLEKAHKPVKEYLIKETFKNDISKRNRGIVVERWLSSFEKSVKENDEFKAIVKERAKPGVNMLLGLMEISRTYLKMLVDLILDGPEALKGQIPFEKLEVKFGVILKKVSDLFAFDIVEFLYHSCRAGMADVEKVVGVFSIEMMKGAPSNLRGILEKMSSSMMTKLMMGVHERVKKEYPKRQPVRTVFEGILPQISEEKKEEEVEIKRQEDMENEVLFKKETIVKKEAEPTKEDEKKKKVLKIKKEKWMKGLSNEQIVDVISTVAKDSEKKVVKQKEFSTSYLDEKDDNDKNIFTKKF